MLNVQSRKVWSLKSRCVKPIQSSIASVIVPPPSPWPPSRFNGTQPGVAAQVSGGPRATSIRRALWAPCFTCRATLRATTRLKSQ